MIRSYKVAFVLLFVGLLVLTVLAVSSSAYRGATEASLDFPLLKRLRSLRGVHRSSVTALATGLR